jgi:uncharacterized protein (DUF736 family)
LETSIMTEIGRFARHDGGFRGRLRTLSHQADLVLVPLAPAEGGTRGPAFRIHLGDDADGPEVGAAWRRTGEKVGAYLALVLDDPLFPKPIRANLFADADGEAFRLIWVRPNRSAPQS